MTEHERAAAATDRATVVPDDSGGHGLDRRRFLAGAALAAPLAVAGTALLPSGTAAAAPARTPVGSVVPSTAGTAALPPAARAAQDPDFGPNVYVFDPSMKPADIQAVTDAVYARTSQFGAGRYALLFKPGGYEVPLKVGYYTHVAGLGLQPAATSFTSSIYAGEHGNATTNFWRGVENLNTVPTSGTDTWAVSQGTFYRRIYLLGNLTLSDGGYSSGGFIADCQITGQIDSGTQQQWITRNSVIGQWLGSNWNIVFAGVDNGPHTSFPLPPYTNVGNAPVSREKPVLYVDADGTWQVLVPAVRRDSHGPSWYARHPAGQSVPITSFHVAKPSDTAATLNAALARGKHLLLTPATYTLSEPLVVTRPGTVILGLGYATLRSTGSHAAIEVADVEGVQIAGLIVEPGSATATPSVLVRLGERGAHRSHARNPSALFDVTVRIGGAVRGSADTSLEVNSNDVLLDNVWLWRADHGTGAGWTSNRSDQGLVVNGDDVTAYGLFVEHHQKNQVLWRGEHGRTYFLQSEMPYDVPRQSEWMDGTRRGYPSYRVDDRVGYHEAWGLGSYCIFADDPSVVADSAFLVPNRSTVRLHSMITFSLGGGIGTIRHIANNVGGPSDADTPLGVLTTYPER